MLHDSATVWVLSHLQQDLLHISVLAWGVDQPGNALLQSTWQSHQLDKLAFWTFVHLQVNNRKDFVESHVYKMLSCSILVVVVVVVVL